jgi:hypothetical protein
VTLTRPLPPAVGSAALDGDKEYVHGAPGWMIVKVWPAMLIEP